MKSLANSPNPHILNNPDVSVIIPTFNRSVHVVLAIESVLQQTFQNYEIIVIDDGSTDDTRARLDPYLERIRYFYQSNRGAVAAQNAGLQRARGAWISILGSDDKWDPAMLHSQMAALHELGDGVRACFTDCAFTGDPALTKTAFEFSQLDTSGRLGIVDSPIHYMVKDKYAFYVQSMLASSELLREIGGFDERLVTGEDQDLIFRLSYKTKFGYLAAPLALINRSQTLPRLTDLYRRRDAKRYTHEESRLKKLLSHPELTDTEIRQELHRELVELYYHWAASQAQKADLPGLGRCALELESLGETRLMIFRELISRAVKKTIRLASGISMVWRHSAHA